MLKKIQVDTKFNKCRDYCVVCGRELKGACSWVGINMETGNYTYDENLATQGLFPIGKDCEKKLELNWKCPVCGAGSIGGMAVEHAKNCNYCEKRIKRMLADDKKCH